LSDTLFLYQETFFQDLVPATALLTLRTGMFPSSEAPLGEGIHFFLEEKRTLRKIHEARPKKHPGKKTPVRLPPLKGSSQLSP